MPFPIRIRQRARRRPHQEQLLLPLLHRQGRLRQGLEGRAQEAEAELRHEGDVEGAHHNEEKRQVGNEREENIDDAEEPIHCEYVLCVLRQGKFVLGDGLIIWRRSPLSHM